MKLESHLQSTDISARTAETSENCKWYSSLPLDAAESPFCASV